MPVPLGAYLGRDDAGVPAGPLLGGRATCRSAAARPSADSSAPACASSSFSVPDVDPQLLRALRREDRKLLEPEFLALGSAMLSSGG